MINVAALTVIKDEGSYIIDWVSHCFYMGFSSVYIAINRTSDDTYEILQEQYSNDARVNIYTTDWIDWFSPDESKVNKNLQQYSFCFLLNEAAKDNKISHFISMDADEFWFSVDFTIKINDFISNLPYFDVMSIHWANQSGDESEFEYPFQNSSFLLRPLVKTLMNRKALKKIKQFRLHVPKFYDYDQLVHVNGDGHFFSSSEKDHIRKSQSCPLKGSLEMKTMILHRMLRSEIEYIALLHKNSPDNALPIKNNRLNGFNKEQRNKVKISQDLCKKYRKYIEDERAKSKLTLASQKGLILKKQIVMNVSEDVLSDNIEIYLLTFSGTDLLDYFLDRYIKSSSSSSELRELALKFEEKDVKVAYKLIKASYALEHPVSDFL
ncbi:hypothetical protein MGA5115_03104 [Marinomonas gallaica]|uniref:Glycosyl transferase family 2 n=1 Tax=Marinomonas gallaica TaxID=1806667 RepID=A0A1C3JUS7_9GAMM|nr:glycosyltransferase family 2 protein [Marinomonas gallaica]SBT18943.1 hypothetical protein MGA5115_03104 [Marinomonas gallaica]SBT21898.1 hypothetical protein MGA5116_02508 [Marinomonas gallaica]